MTPGRLAPDTAGLRRAHPEHLPGVRRRPSAQIVDVVPRRIQMMLDWIPRGAAAGDAGLRRLMSHGEPKRSQAALNELVPRLRRIRPLLD